MGGWNARLSPLPSERFFRANVRKPSSQFAILIYLPYTALTRLRSGVTDCWSRGKQLRAQ
jgi:hypothetical protein